MKRTAWIVTLAVSGLCTAPSLAGDKEIAVVIRLCEGEDPPLLMGDEALEKWDDCDVPLAEVPVKLFAGEEVVGPVETDEHGVAQLEPVTVPDDADLRLVVASTTHACLTLELPARALSAGENRILRHARPNPEPEEEGS